MQLKTRSLSNALWLVAVAGWAQTPDRAFDVASIKLAAPGVRGYSMQPLPGRFSAKNVTLKMLIAEAYHVYDFQVSDTPKWAESDRFNVEAKTDGSANKAEIRVMLQKLLADRFGLKVRHEPKEMPVFAMEVAKNGPKFQCAKQPDAAVMFRIANRRLIVAENAPLDHLTETLTWLVGRPVVDETKLEGSFDYKLEWSPDEMQTSSQEAPVEVEGNLPSLGVALQQQMGLKLVSKKSLVDQIVVVKAKKPTEN